MIEWHRVNLEALGPIDGTAALGSVLITSHGSYSVFVAYCEQHLQYFASIQTPDCEHVNTHTETELDAQVWCETTVDELVNRRASLN